MVARDDLGYELRIGAHTPPHGWWVISTLLAGALTKYRRDGAGVVSKVGVVTPRHSMGSLQNPKAIGRGDLDIAICNPPITAKWAMEGRGPYSEPVGNLRAIARFPEADYTIWLVDETFGITSLEQIAERRIPLRVVSGRMGPEGPDPISFVIEEVMNAYGFGQKALESWGGKVIHAGHTGNGVQVMKRGEADALFQEAAFNRAWDDLVASRPMRALPISRDVIDKLNAKWGMEEATVPGDRFPGMAGPLPTIHYGGWLVFCRDDLPDELAYLVAKTCVDISEEVGAPQLPRPVNYRALEVPITPKLLSSRCVIPLHPGAERFYREIGAIE